MNSFWKRRVSSVSLLLAALSCAALLSVPRTAAAAVTPTTELGGRHWRFDTTSNGPVHVWVPPDYEPSKAITVVHVHGDAEVKTLSADCQGGRVDYVTPYTAGKYSDAAWAKMRLAEQFGATGLNAMFVFPDGPVNREEREAGTRVWRSLSALLDAVKTQIGQVVPEKIVVSGHSGAYATMSHWTGEKRVAAFVLLDSTYGGASTWSNWFAGGATRRLAVIHTGALSGSGTTAKTAKAIAGSTKAKTIDAIPGSASDLATQAGENRAVVIRSQYCHSDIIRLGKTIPVVLPWAAGTAVAQTAGTDATAAAPDAEAAAPGTGRRIVQTLPESYPGPRLEIPIPNVTFTDAIRSEGVITFPWLAQYIGGVYTFLIGIVGLVGAVMMVVGGFQYVTAAGDKNKTSAGKKRIVNALTGMIIALGSYTILYTINPDLVQFEGLKVMHVDQDPWNVNFDATLGDTTETTSDDGDDGAAYTAVESCPLPLTQPKGTKAAKLEFYGLVQRFERSNIFAMSKRQKVLAIAAVADACDVNLGSCGATAGAINALAGVGDTTCLADASSCNDDSKGPEMFAISGRQRREIYGRNCALWDENKMVNGDCVRRSGKKCIEYEQITKSEKTRRTLVSVWRKYTDNPAAKAEEVKKGCFTKNKDATAAVRKYLEEQAETDPKLKGWPKAWADRLQPGDRLVIYNGNNDLVGSHAVIFVGWASEGLMNVVQGGNGGSGTQKDVTRPGKICITPKCGKETYKPLINGWSPN